MVAPVIFGSEVRPGYDPKLKISNWSPSWKMPAIFCTPDVASEKVKDCASKLEPTPPYKIRTQPPMNRHFGRGGGGNGFNRSNGGGDQGGSSQNHTHPYDEKDAPISSIRR
ncbi:MAG: hypothetical protein ACJA1L_003509 [Paracoccaceae bacterium]|jgi:hypothetical protein